jgi:hypothetical protein
VDILGIAAYAGLSLRIAHVAKLGGQEYLVPAARLLEPPPYELLVLAVAVDIAGVPERHAEVGCSREHLEGLLVVVPAEGGVAERHAHTPEAHGGDIVVSDLSLGELGRHCTFSFGICLSDLI